MFDDCWFGLNWVASHNTTLENVPTNSDPWILNHGDFNKVFLGGDSAGATIVHTMAIRAGVEKLPFGVKIFGAYMNHPFFWGSKPLGFEKVEMYDTVNEFAHLLWEFVYPNSPNGIDNPMLNPVSPYGPDLSKLGCSKMLITVAGNDDYRDGAVLYYEAVKGSDWNGEVELFDEEDEGHVYYIFSTESEKGQKLIKVVADFLLQCKN